MRLLPVLLLSWVLLTGCAAVPVKRDYNESADFAGLKTYAWRSETPRADSLMDDRIRAAVEASLSEKGFKKTAEGTDFLVDYRYKVENRSDPNKVSTGVGVGMGSGGISFGGVSLGVGLGRKNYEEEELAIEALDPKTGKAIWQGSARQTPAGSDDPKKTTKRVNSTVKAILAKFPPGGKHK